MEELKLFLPEEIDSSLYEEISLFKKTYYDPHFPWLLSPYHLAIEQELNIEKRSLYSLYYENETLTGCARLTPFPFEMTAHHPDLHALGELYRNHLEISRLFIRPASSTEGRKFIQRTGWKWMSALFQQLSQSKKLQCNGLVGIATADKLNYFQQCGMATLGHAVALPQRKNREYTFIHKEF